jgi:polyferredoxin
MNVVAFKKKRSRLQAYTWFGLPLVVVGGWFYPRLGFLLLGCMLGALAIALYKGRAWCDWMCPRGSFYDLFLRKISLRRSIPGLFRRKGFRFAMLGVLFAVLGSQVYLGWGDGDAIGLAMVKLLTITTTVGILLGVAYQERIWCHICPMGTLGNYLSEGKYPLAVKDDCVDCTACAKVCPMQLAPYRYKASGVMRDNDCIKCATCVAACPKKALLFPDEVRKAA